MKTKYSWNRNVSHHRIAVVKFAVIGYLFGVAGMIAANASISSMYDGTNQFVVRTMVIGFTGMVFIWVVVFSLMTLMYRWVCDMDIQTDEKSPPAPVVEEQINLYQLENGNYKLVRRNRVGGSVNRG